MRRSLTLVLVVFVVAVPGLAEPAFVASYKEVQTHAGQIQTILRKPELTAEDSRELARLAEAGMGKISETIDGLKAAMDGAIAGLHGASLSREEPPDPTFPFRVDHNTAALLRANVMQGNFQPVATLLELTALNIRLVSDWLNLAHAAAVSKGRPRLPYGDYRIIRTQLRNAVDAAARIFPELPRLPVSAPDADGRLKGDESRLAAFFAYLTPIPGQPVPDGAKRFALQAIGIIDGAIITVDNYHRFYPQQGNEAALTHMSISLQEMPGAHECIGLARGMSDFEGPPCQPSAFRAGIQRYIEFYERNAGNGSALMSTVLEFLAGFDETEGADAPEEKWLALKADLDRHISRSRFHARIKERWPRIRDELFGDLARLKTLMADGPALHAFLQSRVFREGIQPRQGFDGDYLENVEAARDLLRQFERQQLDRIEGTVERVGVASACKPYIDEDRSRAPWVVNTLVAAETEPRAEASADGYRRLIWPYEARVGNAVTIQNSQVPDKVLAGLAIHTGLRLLVPNVVMTRSLLGRDVGQSLEDLGLQKKEESEPLATVHRHYRFPAWDSVISATKAAFDDMLLAYAKDNELMTEWAAEGGKSRVKDRFIAKFRTEMAEGAAQLREVADALATVQRDGARLAAPAISTILDIPLAYTGEEDRRFAAQVNDSLIKVFLPTIITEYIYRKWPDTRTNRDLFTEHYRRLQSSFTIDQFMDQMEWYAWPDYDEGSRIRWELIRSGEIRLREPPYDGPFRKPGLFSGPRVAIMGVDKFKLLYRYPVLCAGLLNHTMDAYQRKIDYLEYAQKRLYYRFPALRLNDAWRAYDDSKFETTLDAFLKNAVDEGNKILALKRAPEALDYFVPNLPLMDIVLRYHPDQKKQLCLEQKSRKQWDERTDTVLGAVSMVATTAAYVPVLAPVGIVVEGVVLVIEAARAYEKYQEMARAERLLFAGQTQMDFDSVEAGRYYLREMEGVYGEALARFAVHTALVAPAVVLKMPPLAKIPGMLARTPRAFLRAAKVLRAEIRAARALEQAAAQAALQTEAKALWFANSTSRLARSLDLLNRIRHKLMSPFVKLGLAERWTHRSFFQRFYQNLSLRRAHRFVLNIPGAAKDVFLNLPWSVLGYQWGNGLLARGIQAYSLYEMSLWIIHGIQGASEAATELVMERVHQNPEAYGDLVEGMYNGDYRHADLVAMIELDDRLGVLYRERAHEQVTAYYRALEPAERRTALENLRLMETELTRQITEEEGRADFDPNRARILRRTHRHLRRTIQSLALIAREAR